MSIGITYPGVSPSDVWNYSTRKLTERFGIIERARGYASGLSKIYDETRFINGILYLFGNGRGAIVIVPDDDIAYSKTFTLIKAVASGTFPSCVTDHNDTTYCQWSFPTYLPTDYFYIDMGGIWSGVIRVYIYNSGATGLNILINGSNDARTWTQVASVPGPASGAYGDVFLYVSGYRYYTFSTSASSLASGAYFNLYSYEAYPDTALSITRSFSNLGKRIVAYVYASYYQLLEVITI